MPARSRLRRRPQLRECGLTRLGVQLIPYRMVEGHRLAPVRHNKSGVQRFRSNKCLRRVGVFKQVQQQQSAHELMLRSGRLGRSRKVGCAEARNLFRLQSPCKDRQQQQKPQDHLHPTSTSLPPPFRRGGVAQELNSDLICTGWPGRHQVYRNRWKDVIPPFAVDLGHLANCAEIGLVDGIGAVQIVARLTSARNYRATASFEPPAKSDAVTESLPGALLLQPRLASTPTERGVAGTE